MLKQLAQAGVLMAAGVTAAHAAPATLIDGSHLGWATHCQQNMTATEVGNRKFQTTGCPITLGQAVKEWDYAYLDEMVTVADRYTSRDLPEWVESWQEGSLAALKEHLEANGFDGVTVKRIVGGGDRAAASAIADNEKLPKLQREELGLIVVATEPGLAVEYKGEIENPNPHYTGSNPFKQLGGAMSAWNNGPFVFDGVAELTATQRLAIYDPAGELLDERTIQASTTTDAIHLSMDDPKIGSFDMTATYGQMLEIKKNGRATKPSSDIEDNRYERFKAAFADLGETLAEGVPAAFDDTQRIAEAAGL